MNRKSLVKGTLILAAAGMIAKVLGFFFRIPLIYLIGDQGMGLYQLTYPLYTFLLAFAAGIPVAISKMISERMALNKRKEAKKVFNIALVTMVALGGASTFGLLMLSQNIIEFFNWSQDAYYTILGISFAPLFTCLLSAYRGYFQGLQEMTPPAASQVLEQLIRICVGVGLAYLLVSQGVPKAAGGASFGAVAGALIGFLFMFYCYRRSRIYYNREERTASRRALLTEILKIAIPISLGQAIGSIMALIDSMVVPNLLKALGYTDYTAMVLYGQLTGKAHVLINIPLTLSMALSQNVVPAISSAYALKDYMRLNRNIQTSFKFAMVLALPCCAGFLALANPIITLVFQGKGEGWELLQILSIATIFIVLAQTATSVMNGIGKAMLPVVAMVIGSGVKIILNFILIPIPELNIKAAAIATLAAYILIAILDIIFVIRTTKVYINIQEAFIMPTLCTVVMTFAVLLLHGRLTLTEMSGNLATLISILGGGIIYIIMILITGTLSISEIRGYIKR